VVRELGEEAVGAGEGISGGAFYLTPVGN